MLATTGLWAIAFIPPLAMPEAAATEIALGRYFVYGVISACALRPHLLRQLNARMVVTAFAFALAGNIAYYELLVIGIQLAGAPLAILIIGMIPVSVAVIGYLQARDAVWSTIAAPLILFTAGVLLFNAAKTDFYRDISAISPLGIGCMVACLIMWTWYAIANADFLRRNPAISPAQWNTLIGVACLMIVLTALPIALATGHIRSPNALGQNTLVMITLWSLLLGAGTTWLGTMLFNHASKLLNVSLLGQLIIFEAVFGVIYVLLYAGTAPHLLEIAGITIALLAIWWSTKRLQDETLRKTAVSQG